MIKDTAAGIASASFGEPREAERPGQVLVPSLNKGAATGQAGYVSPLKGCPPPLDPTSRQHHELFPATPTAVTFYLTTRLTILESIADLGREQE